MNNEKWDYKINGKIGGVSRIVICLALSIIFTILTVDQLQPQLNKSIPVTFAFGSLAVLSLCFFIKISNRYFYFKLYIGSKGFYFQSAPLNGKYYEYTSIKSCIEKLDISHHHHSTGFQYYYFFIFTEMNGKTRKFQFEKPTSGHEINELKERIESQTIII